MQGVGYWLQEHSHAIHPASFMQAESRVTVNIRHTLMQNHTMLSRMWKNDGIGFLFALLRALDSHERQL